MEKLLLKALTFAFTLLIFVGVIVLAEQPQESPDLPKPVKTNIGEEFIVILESNATTGYRWQLAKPLDRNMLELLGSEYISDPSGLIGAGGEEEWFFKAIGAGDTTISFKYVRPWEKDAQPAKERTFTVIIKETAYDNSDVMQVMAVEGDPKVMKKGEAQWGDCAAEMLIDDGDRVKTEKGENVEISFAADDSKVIMIEENSDLLIVRGKDPYFIELSNGEVLSIIKKLPPGSSFEVKTPTAISGVRGTEWHTMTDGEKTMFSVFDSAIYTKGIDISGRLMAEETIVQKGWKIEVAKFKRPSPPIKLLENEIAHWNSWKERLEKKIKERGKRKPEIQKKIAHRSGPSRMVPPYSF